MTSRGTAVTSCPHQRQAGRPARWSLRLSCSRRSRREPPKRPVSLRAVIRLPGTHIAQRPVSVTRSSCGKPAALRVLRDVTTVPRFVELSHFATGRQQSEKIYSSNMQTFRASSWTNSTRTDLLNTCSRPRSDKPDRGVLGMLNDLPQVIPVHHDITVAYEHVRMTGFSISGDEIVYFRVESGIALLYEQGNILVGVFVTYFFCHFVGRIVEVLEAKDYFVFRIILGGRNWRGCRKGRRQVP